MRTPMMNQAGMPDHVTIWEVGPRDGLQNERSVLGVDDKVEFLDRLARAGLRTVEATSFVHPRWVPQLADAEKVLAALDRRPGVAYPVLVPNERGLDRALAADVDSIAIFASATESFAQRNLNRPFDGQFAMFEPVVARAVAEGVRVRGYLSMCFGDPWEGGVPIDHVVAAGRRLLDLGCSQLSLGDTIGVATPGHVEELLTAFTSAGVDIGALAVHFHDTYGQALANTLAALRRGVSTVDSSAGGLGGCPYADSATGNLATEDLVWMLDGLGVGHGVDLDALAATSAWMAAALGRPSPSRVVAALTGA
ncbi:MAG: hydroxymethylglutaryl-CoA lyase [Haloechinothrix sp.]